MCSKFLRRHQADKSGSSVGSSDFWSKPAGNVVPHCNSDRASVNFHGTAFIPWLVLDGFGSSGNACIQQGAGIYDLYRPFSWKSRPYHLSLIHIYHGIRLILGDGVSRILADRVILSSGMEVKADMVVMAIGVAPETSLAVKAGLEIGETRGIRVNHNYQTSDPDIYAVGDAIDCLLYTSRCV